MIDKDTFLQILRGAPLSVLLALWVHGAQRTGDIAHVTDYHRGTVAEALRFLADDCQLVDRVHYRQWALGSGAQQLPIFARGPVDNSVKPVDNFLSDGAESRENRLSGGETAVVFGPESRKNRLSANGTGSQIVLKVGKTGFQAAESRKNQLSDDTCMYDHNIHTEASPITSIIAQLEALGFRDAAQFIGRSNPELVAAWLAYYDSLELKQRRQFRNFGGLLRKQVGRGVTPPLVVRRPTCPDCGRFLTNGRCLVCEGVVMV